MPLAGSAAAVVTGSAFASVAEAAPAAPDADAGTLGSLAGVQGQFESCDAYFGFGKELVAFDVVDQNGADGVAHEVPTDTQVIFVLEDEDGDTLECLPEELTEEEWDDFATNGPYVNVPAYPGPGHFVYPSIENGADIEEEGFGSVQFAGFRVGTIPAGHSLVSPTGTVELLQSQLDGADLLFGGLTDPRIGAHVTANASDAAATAFDQAVEDCAEGNPTLDGADLLDAVEVLEALTTLDVDDEISCNDVRDLNFNASGLLGLQESIAYTETITLALPVQATSTTSTTVAPTSTSAAVAPTTVARVLARTGDRSSLPTALVGVGSIAAGALVLAARRRLHQSR